MLFICFLNYKQWIRMRSIRIEVSLFIWVWSINKDPKFFNILSFYLKSNFAPFNNLPFIVYCQILSKERDLVFACQPLKADNRDTSYKLGIGLINTMRTIHYQFQWGKVIYLICYGRTSSSDAESFGNPIEVGTPESNNTMLADVFELEWSLGCRNVIA